MSTIKSKPKKLRRKRRRKKPKYGRGNKKTPEQKIKEVLAKMIFAYGGPENPCPKTLHLLYKKVFIKTLTKVKKYENENELLEALSRGDPTVYYSIIEYREKKKKHNGKNRGTSSINRGKK